MKNSLKSYINILLLAITCTGLMFLSSCGGGGSDPAPATKADEAKKILTSSTWRAVAVTVDQTDQTPLYKNLTVKFSDNTYTSTNGEPLWPASGTWSFVDSDGTAITRSDNVVITIDVLNDQGVILSFTWNKTTLVGGRETSIPGKYTFIFNK